MGLSCSNIKKCLIFQETETLKNYLYFRKWNFLALILGNFLYFLKRKLSLYFGKWKFYILGNGNPEKISNIFSKESFFCISGNGNSKKTQISGSNFPCLKNEKKNTFKKTSRKKFLIFSQKKLFLCFRKGNILIFSELLKLTF